MAKPLLFVNSTNNCDKMVSLNEKSMIKSQHYVKEVNNLPRQFHRWHVETDTSYNNRPQSGSQSAAQSLTPLVELNTTKKDNNSIRHTE